MSDDVAEPDEPPHMFVSAVCFVDAEGRLLTVRKRGTLRLMLPGGKLEPGESAAEAACRECAEEIGVSLHRDALQPLGTWRGDAANEDGQTIEATVFLAGVRIDPVISREIEEARWLPIRDPEEVSLAPLLHEFVLPMLAARLTTRP